MSLPSPFECCGLASRRDLDRPELLDLLHDLEAHQQSFLEYEEAFRSDDYAWPRDALHWWSRVWEYPFAYHHLQRWGPRNPDGSPRKVVDVGCGVTFFPHALARSGFHVVCTDVDEVCRRDVKRAIAAIPQGEGEVSYRHIVQGRLPFDDGEIDGLYCISVLEHLSDFDATIDEMARIVAPGGLAVLTLDLDLRGDLEIGPDRYYRLLQRLERHFEPLYPLRAVHPADVLTSANSPYRIRHQGAPLRRILWSRLRYSARKLVHRGPGPFGPAIPFLLAVDGWVLVRSENSPSS